MKYVVSIAAICPMRKDPSHRSEMVSQLLFGEFAVVLETDNDFIRVKCLFDGYEGWCQTSQLQPTDVVLYTERYLIAQTNTILIAAGTSVPVVFGSPVYGFDEGEINFGSRTIACTIPEENTWIVSPGITTGHMRFIAEKYLGASYLWGGKSLFGIDCSGFVQQVYKFFGVKLLRDAYLQAQQGEAVQSFSDIRFGDLAFFKNENEKITHVGLMLEDYKIIHASGRVRVDELKEDGIYNSETGERSHVMHSVRRPTR